MALLSLLWGSGVTCGAFLVWDSVFVWGHGAAVHLWPSCSRHAVVHEGPQMHRSTVHVVALQHSPAACSWEAGSSTCSDIGL